MPNVHPEPNPFDAPDPAARDTLDQLLARAIDNLLLNGPDADALLDLSPDRRDVLRRYQELARARDRRAAGE